MASSAAVIARQALDLSGVRGAYTNQGQQDVACKPQPTFRTRNRILRGPDYIKDHLPKLHEDPCYIGEKRPIAEKTGDLKYLWRPAPHLSLPAKYKHNYVGEIGWGIPEYDFISRSNLKSNFHIKYGELSHACAGYLTHKYQNPWQPKPHIMDKQGKGSRGSMAWHMSDYEDTTNRNSKSAILVRENKAPTTSKLPTLHSKVQYNLLLSESL
ncbi:PREDICTED: uncharacterized protein C4orf45 homolog [Elephantulus edwardii]|uniref:uncharacterized protein C4orf45 homolog n=1 Tax=Elephantulus edwardii TaxID=28737 RepID=UPI0003F088EA|nr:PREDICTED: uncharacterized protein C4orf45 homolog [Elephantulus edwardii]